MPADEWLTETGFRRRPLVIVEDRLYHLCELLSALRRRAPRLLGAMTVVCLERSGPDTQRLVRQWLDEDEQIQVAARLDSDGLSSLGEPSAARFLPLQPAALENSADFCRTIAGLLRPRGLLLQDIHLETLRFVPRDRWWESTLLASTIRGMFARRTPSCAFMSNKKGYEATFGAELLEAGFDPRDVLNKNRIESIVIAKLEGYLKKTFPWRLELSCSSRNSQVERLAVGRQEDDRREIEKALDLVLWPVSDQSREIGGRALRSEAGRPRLCLPALGNEAETWRALIQDRLDDGPGVSVLDVGARLAPEGALRAEVTNAAARHLHALRKKLKTAQDIRTVEHAYRLQGRLSIGLVRRGESF